MKDAEQTKPDRRPKRSRPIFASNWSLKDQLLQVGSPATQQKLSKNCAGFEHLTQAGHTSCMPFQYSKACSAHQVLKRLQKLSPHSTNHFYVDTVRYSKCLSSANPSVPNAHGCVIRASHTNHLFKVLSGSSGHDKLHTKQRSAHPIAMTNCTFWWRSAVRSRTAKLWPSKTPKASKLWRSQTWHQRSKSLCVSSSRIWKDQLVAPEQSRHPMPWRRSPFHRRTRWKPEGEKPHLRTFWRSMTMLLIWQCFNFTAFKAGYLQVIYCTRLHTL